MPTESTEKHLKKEFHLTLSKFVHEIRNPVALISSELQLMASAHPKLCSYEQWDSLMDNLEYIKELLNEFSDYNNAEKISPVPVNINEFLNTIISCEKTTMSYLGITLETHMEEIHDKVLLDRVKMRQALLNLLRNACESIEQPKGKIIVSLTREKNKICISIKDNGCGMTDEQREKIFSPFVSYKTAGTGLGLAVTKDIILAHKGSIDVISSPGHGSTFRIFLG
ncbi:MAG: HAMP domain-containing sensor histidine kinase [Blautia sp.]|nr:HAMP domain-containing sensor histidine kinase [Blautia sp.]